MNELQLPLPLRISLQRAVWMALVRTHPNPKELQREWDEMTGPLLLAIRQEIETQMSAANDRVDALRAIVDFTEELRSTICEAVIKNNDETQLARTFRTIAN